MTKKDGPKAVLQHRRNDMVHEEFASEKEALQRAKENDWTIIGEAENREDGTVVIYYLP
jgi:hypothetical protein